jgi:hypothetical protein
MGLERATRIMLGIEKPGDKSVERDRQRAKISLPVLKCLERPLPPDIPATRKKAKRGKP